jgi:hypothetical protein
MNKGREFEELITLVERAVHNLTGVSVQHNVKLPAKHGGERQIDVLITDQRNRFTFKTIIECKNTHSKVSVNTVGAFKDLMESVGAHQGIIVSASDFQRGAINSAKGSNIFLYQFSQVTELEDHLQNRRFNSYNVTHKSTEFSVFFREKKSINTDITIYIELFSPLLNKKVSLVKVAEDILRRAKPFIIDKLLHTITDLAKRYVLIGQTEININFPTPLIHVNNNDFTEIVGIRGILETKLEIEPTEIKSVSEYKDIVESKTHAFVFEVEQDGKIYTLLEKK